jgi:hypothetical protein
MALIMSGIGVVFMLKGNWKGRVRGRVVGSRARKIMGIISLSCCTLNLMLVSSFVSIISRRIMLIN